MLLENLVVFMDEHAGVLIALCLCESVITQTTFVVILTESSTCQKCSTATCHITYWNCRNSDWKYGNIPSKNADWKCRNANADWKCRNTN